MYTHENLSEYQLLTLQAPEIPHQQAQNRNATLTSDRKLNTFQHNT